MTSNASFRFVHRWHYLCIAGITYAPLQMVALMSFDSGLHVQNWALRKYGSQKVSNEAVFAYLSLFIKKVKSSATESILCP